MTRKIFVLGDSRTGTMTLHKFFLALGIKSIHYFIKESGVISPDHNNRKQNTERVLRYIADSGFEAFSDYPTRSYYAELFENYPDAYFILTIRKNVDVWKKSMSSFFSKFSMKLDLEKLSKAYISINEKISLFFNERNAKFLKICIDDNIDKNSSIIKGFLEINSSVQMGWENKSLDYDNSVLSKRAQLYSPPNNGFFEYINSRLGDSKAMPSEYGWIYLANDTNSFLEYQFGKVRWSENDLERTKSVMKHRNDYFRSRKIVYRKFVVPEKSIVYPEFLPRCFDGLKEVPDRPAKLLAEAGLESYEYLGPYFLDAKSRGILYFSGDTHINWLGAYFLYYRIVEILNHEISAGRLIKPIALSELAASIAQYGGDLAVQLNEELASEIGQTWRTILPKAGGEYVIRYILPKSLNSCVELAPSIEYKKVFSERPLFIKEHSDKTLPKAVIFRDSTADFVIDLLAQHFSRSVFIWHKGQVYEDVIAHEKPDIVIHIMAERFISMYPTFSPTINIGI